VLRLVLAGRDLGGCVVAVVGAFALFKGGGVI
jgi:hypothetical protein